MLHDDAAPADAIEAQVIRNANRTPAAVRATYRNRLPGVLRVLKVAPFSSTNAAISAYSPAASSFAVSHRRRRGRLTLSSIALTPDPTGNWSSRSAKQVRPTGCGR